MQKYLSRFKQNENKDSMETFSKTSKSLSVPESMNEEYQQLAEWLHQFDLGQDELKDMLPALYQDIQDTIEKLDGAFLNEDLTAFQSALEMVRSLYAEALFKCGRRVAVKVWSELLNCYLWVVANDEDMQSMRSQGNAEAIYTRKEIAELKKLPKEHLKDIHKVKEIFECSKIERVKRNES